MPPEVPVALQAAAQIEEADAVEETSKRPREQDGLEVEAYVLQSGDAADSGSSMAANAAGFQVRFFLFVKMEFVRNIDQRHI